MVYSPCVYKCCSSPAAAFCCCSSLAGAGCEEKTSLKIGAFFEKVADLVVVQMCGELFIIAQLGGDEDNTICHQFESHPRES